MRSSEGMMNGLGTAGLLAALFLSPLFLVGCREKRDTPRAAEPSAPTVPVVPPVPPPPPAPVFQPFEVTGSKALHELEQTLGKDAFAEVLKLNRLSRHRVLKGTTLMVPTGDFDYARLGPFPDGCAPLSDQPQILLVSLRVQAWAAYESGKLVRWGPVSTGKKLTPTPVGFYHTNWRQLERNSTFNGEWLLKWYVNIHNASGVSFHEYELPGFPESHSCVRLSADDAEWIYRWCHTWTLSSDQRTVTEQGTPVVVFGDYAWGEPGPWKRWQEDPDACRLETGEMDAATQILRAQTAPVFPEPVP